MSELQRVPAGFEVAALRERILALERDLFGLPTAQRLGPEDFVTRHHFAPGSYAREIELPAGSLVVGKIHIHAHVNVLSKGRALVATPDGVEELCAPLTFVSKPGTKRAVFAIEDVVWTTIHCVGDERDLAKIEALLIAPSFEALEDKS